jgi:tRNA(Ile2) C34 agmatinyltransferase TiaS
MENEKIIDLTPNIVWHNICVKCGAENTLNLMFKGRKKYYRCEECNQNSRGVTQAKYDELQAKKGLNYD